MEGILVFLIMTNIRILRALELISLKFQNRVLKLKGLVKGKNKDEYLEVIIYKGFSSSTTHNINSDPEQIIFELECKFTECGLYEAPLSSGNNPIKTNKDIILFLNEKNWN